MKRILKSFPILLLAELAAAQFVYVPFEEIRNSSEPRPQVPRLVPVQYRMVPGPGAVEPIVPPNLTKEQIISFAAAIADVEAAAGRERIRMTPIQIHRLTTGLATIDKKFVDPIPAARWDAILKDMVEVARKEYKPGGWDEEYKPEGWDAVIDHMLQTAIKNLKEPHTDYMDPKQAQSYLESTNGTLTGIGVAAAADPRGMKLDVVYPNSGAQRAGLLEGDVIVEVDGRRVGGMALRDIIGLVRGDAGTSVAITVLRAGGEVGPLTIVRSKVEIPNAFSRMAAPGVGYVYFSQFQPDTDKRVLGLIEGLRAQGARSVILDVRGNPGGRISSVASIASEFLHDGDDIVSFKHQGLLAFKAVTEGDGKHVDVAVAVLVDAGSASASEILSGALQDKRRGYTVIGSRTYGKGSEQAVLPQIGDRMLKITENRWYTPDDRNIDARHDQETGFEVPGTGGIVPDVVVDVPAEQAAKVRRQIASELVGKAAAEPRAADPVLEKAIEVLTGADAG